MSKLAVLYARVSSKEQEKEGFSIPAQMKLLRDYARQYKLPIAKEFEEAETAKVSGRPKFNEMVAYLRDPKNDCNTILVEKTDRLYRNLKDWIVIEELGTKIHFVKEGETLDGESHSSHKFMHGIRVLMAKQYVDNLSEEVRKGMNEKAAQGQWPARPPVGYSSNRESHTIEPDPTKAPIVRRLFEWYASGDHSLESVAKLAKSSALFSRNSMAINKAGIHRILHNPIYCGEFEWKGKRYQGTHEPIVTRELFAKTQMVFDETNRPLQTKRSLAFAGLLKCGKCGCSMTPELKKERYVYYHCTQFRGPCDNVYVREEKLANLLGEVVQKVRVSPKVVEDIRQALLYSQRDKLAYQSESIESIRERISRLQGMLDNAYEDKLSGEITPDTWRRKSTEWQGEIDRLRLDEAAHSNANRNYYELGMQILELANSAFDQYIGQNRVEQRKLLDTLLSNCTFYRGTLCPTYKKPFDILAKGLEFQSMRGRRDSNSRPPT